MATADWNSPSWQMPEVGSSDWYQWMGNQAGANAAASAPSPYKAPQPATYLDTVTNDSLDRSNQALGTTVGPPSQSYYGEEWLFGGPPGTGSQPQSSPYGAGGPSQADLDKIIQEAKDQAARNTAQYAQGQEKQAAAAYNQPPPAEGQPGSSSWYQQKGDEAKQQAVASLPTPQNPPPGSQGFQDKQASIASKGATQAAQNRAAAGAAYTGIEAIDNARFQKEQQQEWLTPKQSPEAEAAARAAVQAAKNRAAAEEANRQYLSTGGTPSAQMALLNAGKLANDPTLPGQAELTAPEVNARLSQSTLSGGLYSQLQNQGTLGTLTSGGPGMSAVQQGITGLGTLASGNTLGQQASANAVYGLQGLAQGGQARSALDIAKGIYGSPLASEKNYAGLVGSSGEPAALDQFYGQYGRSLMQPGAVGQASGDINSKINSANALSNAFGREQGMLYGPGYTQNLASAYKPETGYAEALYTGEGANALDKYYGNLINRGSRNLSEAAAARGGFNTGASLRSIEELNRDLSAQQAKDYVDLASKADASRELSRRFGLDLAQSGDKTAYEKAQLALSTAGDIDKNTLDKAAKELEAAKAREDETQKRFGLTSDTAKAVSDLDLRKKQLLTDASTSASTAALDRATQGVLSGNIVDKTVLDAYLNAGTLGINRDAATRAANELLVTGGKTQSEMLNAGVGQASDLASRADALETTRASAQASAASLAQAAREGRIDAQLAREAQAVVNAAQSAANQLSTADAEALANALNEIQTALNQEGVDSATTMAVVQAQKDKIAQILKGAEIVAGKKKE